jgi:hypothetical protein
MSFKCPQCGDPDSLEIVASIQLPKEQCINEVTLQVVECNSCQFGALAVYEEKRHSPMDTRDWKHVGYLVQENELQAVKQAILECPERLNPDCRCPVHARLGLCDVSGEWVGLDGIDMSRPFVMRMRL